MDKGIDMDFSAVCRTCLGSNSLNSIFSDLALATQQYSTAVYTATGIKVKQNDGLPQNICINCRTCINNTLKFRKICKDTEKELLKILKDRQKVKDGINSEKSVSALKLNNEQKENVQNKNKQLNLSNIKLMEGFESNIIIEPMKEQDSSLNDSETDYVIEVLDDKLLEEDDRPLVCLVNEEKLETDKKGNQLDACPKLKNNKKKKQLTDGIKNSTYCKTKPKGEDSKYRRVTCDLCQTELSSRSLDAHMARKHPGVDQRKLKCDLCDKFILKNKLNRHVKMIHGTEHFRCGYCKSEYSNKDILVEHVTSCAAKKKKRTPSKASRELSECDICHKTMQRASLKMHKAVKHAGLGPVCEHCGHRFGNKFRLKEHYRAKHGYEKFKCSFCEFQSAGMMAMKNHERRHRGEKPFVCETCEATFHAAYLLAQHRHTHRTEKLIKCELCPASFKAVNSLHMHKLSVHGRDRYRCGLCERTYSCRPYAVKHMRHVHRLAGPLPALKPLTTPTHTLNQTTRTIE